MKSLSSMTAVVTLITLAGCATAPQDMAQTSGVGLSSAMSQIPSAGIPSAASAAGQLPAIGSAASMAGSLAGAAPTAAQTPGLVDILVQQLGVTPQQATGGAGSIFSMAQQSMTPSNFRLVSKAVPGMDQLLTAAPASGTTGLMGSAASALGGSSLGNMAGLASSFQGLGMNSGMMSQFIPVIMQYVQTQGGSSTMNLLQSALMP